MIVCFIYLTDDIIFFLCKISCEKLIKLMTILHHSVKDGCKVNLMLEVSVFENSK